MHNLRKDTPAEQFTIFFSHLSNFLVRDLTGGGSWLIKIPMVGNMFRYLPNNIVRPSINKVIWNFKQQLDMQK